jgi:hypothetical protein
MQIGGVLQHILSQHPLLIVFDILALVAAAGCIWVLMRETVLFRGYRSLKRVAKGIAHTIGGSTFRDGEDLVISGFYRGVPTVVRFSFSENTPEVHIWMKVASALTLFVSHKSSRLAEGRMRVPTRDSWFDDRFTIRTDNPNDAVALLADDRAFAEVKRLCCSPGTAFVLNKDSLEMSESTTPIPDTFDHLMRHMDSMGELAVRVGALSNLKAKAKIYVPDRFLIARAALVLLVIGGMIEVYTSVAAYSTHTDAAALAAQPGTDTGDLAAVPVGLPGLSNWRFANANDFDTTTAEWMRQHGKTPTGRLVGDFSGQGTDMGYALVHQGQGGDPMAWRVAMTSQGKAVLDATYDQVLGVMLIPKQALTSIEWISRGNVNPPQAPADGDGLMLIRREGDANIATIYYLSGGTLQSGTPSDYLSVASR